MLDWDRLRLGREANSVLLGPGPRQEFIELLHGPAIDELGENIGQVSLRVDFVQLCGLNERCETCPVGRAFVVARKEAILAIQSNLAAILPISGRMSSSIIAGIHFTGEARVVFRVSGAHQAMSCMWSCRPAL
jgi:hypothetical protein